MLHYRFYTGDPSTDDRLLIYFPAAAGPSELCKKNTCQYAPIMISWSVAIKTLSVGPYWRIMGRTIQYQVLLRFRIFHSIVLSERSVTLGGMLRASLVWLTCRGARRAVTSLGSIVNSVWWAGLVAAFLACHRLPACLCPQQTAPPLSTPY